MDPSSPSREAEKTSEETFGRWWDWWVYPKRPVTPSRAPLSESRPWWLGVQGAGVLLLAAVHVVMCLCTGVPGLPPLRVSDPEGIFDAMTVCYAAGGWLLSWPEPGLRDAIWGDAGGRWGLRFFSLAPAVAAWLLWASWNYVPWWNYGRYRAAAAETLALATVCEWLAFDHLARLAPGTRFPGLYVHFRAARYAASFTLFALAVRGMRGLDDGESWRDMACICFPAELIVLVYPCVLLAGFVPVLIATAHGARRRARLRTAGHPIDPPAKDS